MPLFLLVLALLVAAPAALADPADDYRAVHADWEDDREITPCRWTLEQLENARRLADENPDDTYNGFPEKVDAEIARWRRGDCDSRPRIAAVKAKRERVRIVNEGPRAVKVGGMRLRDRQGHAVRLKRGLEIEPGSHIVVRTARDPMWNDGGDIARLVAKDGTVVSQFGYGRFAGRPRF